MAKNNELSRKLTQDNYVTEKIDVIQNNLLGSYDDDGHYTIAPQIIEELIAMDKVKKTVFGNSIFCVGQLLGYGEIVFELLFNSTTTGNSNALATLFVLEDVDKINGYLQNTIKTKLEDYSRNVDNFIESTYEHFNISTEEDDDDEDDGRERKLINDLNSEDSFIMAKKQYSLLLEKLLSEKYLDAYGKYFTARISMLTKLDNDFSKAVLNSFNHQYSLIENVFLHEKNYKMLNELLDKCVEEVSETNEKFISQEKDFNEKITPALDAFTQNMERLSEKFESKALNMLGKEDRKKVEEILDEHSMEESDDNARESKQSVQQIVNEVRSSRTTPVSEQQTPEAKKEDSTTFIKEMLDSKKQSKVMDTPTSTSFYDAFKSNNVADYSPSVAEETKVVDTSRSHMIDTPNHQERVAVSSLKDRINRLQKFKNSSVLDNATTSQTIMPTESSDTTIRNQDFEDYMRKKSASVQQHLVDDMDLDR